MKRFFAALGKALCYFLLYFGVQILATVLFVFVSAAVFSAAGAFSSLDQMIGEIMRVTLANTPGILFVSGVLTLLFYFIFFLVRKKSFLRETGMVRPSASPILFVPVFVGGLSAHYFLSTAMNLLPLPEQLLESYAESADLLAIDTTSFFGFFAYALLTPLVEEVVFRGLIMTRFARGMPVIAAVLLQAFVFGMVHGNLLWFCYSFLMGVGFGLLFRKFRSLWAPILAHMVFNAANFLPAFAYSSLSAMVITMAVSAVLLVLSIVWMVFIPTDKDPQNAEYAV